jgi:CRISPR-associated protein Cmr5
MSRKTLAQRRAAHALGRIQTHAKSGTKSYRNYFGYVEALPATILMNGLGQAAATLLSKAEGNFTEPHGLLYADVQDWLCGSDAAAPYRNTTGGDDRLMQAIITKDERSYLHAQAEALEYLVWLKKFANAYLERGNNA